MIRIPGSHAPNVKNRSSKHLMLLTNVRPIYRCLSNAVLEEMAKGDGKHKNFDAQKELNRRQKKREKKEGRKA